MEEFGRYTSPEHVSEHIVVIPAGEALQNVDTAVDVWRTEATNTLFLNQISRHQESVQCLDEILEAIPCATMTLEEAIRDRYVTSQQATDLYQSLSSVLKDDDYGRLVLYLPFEFLPAASWVPNDEDLRVATDTFREDYMSTWHDQLLVHDVRANFVDGNVIEKELRTIEPERVVKAAHLLPKLMSLGLITFTEAAHLYRETNDPVLAHSLAESFANINGLYVDHIPSLDDKDTETNSWRRNVWLEQKEIEETVIGLSRACTATITDGDVSLEMVEHLFPDLSEDMSRAVWVETIRELIEVTAGYKPEDAIGIYQDYHESLMGMWQEDNPSTQNRLAKLFRRIHKLDIISDDDLVDTGLPLQNLAGPLSENIQFLTKEVEQLQTITTFLESNPVVAPYVFPVVGLGGSRFKGYGDQSSDLDVCVFIKPDTPVEVKEPLRKALHEIFYTAGQDELPIEFWLDETDGVMSVRDSDNDAYAADSLWVHMLFSAAWVGNPNVIDELRNSLLSTYFYKDDAQIDGRSARQLHLERMEQDLLQYRLMHKGFERHYPRSTTPHSRPSAMLDGTSMFWEPRYRQIATRLFMSMVFLPKL